ncbi:MAG TPA: hypothetical protein VKU60_00155, partial [Chloroflexota bacterium]|nr:hypothetical protein [Chloroflexota bacterium]
QWQTAPDSHIRVYSYNTGFNLDYQTTTSPCFRVYLPNGYMEEFGCTSNAMQFYTTSSTGNYHTADRITAWNLDLITDPQGNQIQVTYQTDSVAGYDNLAYPREMELATVEWDSPTCQDATNRCSVSGTAPEKWAPLHRLVFDMAHTPARLISQGGTCNPASTGGSPTLRCDDPLDESGSGGLKPPDVENTEVLNDVQVETRDSASDSWHTLLVYQASYSEDGPTVTTDPVSGKAISYAGDLRLKKWQTLGSDWSTTLPIVQFGYTLQDAYYEDSNFSAASGAGCGFSWNSSCLLWSKTTLTNDEFLASSSNGQGLASTYTWALARNNTHGVNTSSAADPLACDGHEGMGYPCDEVDDQNWSRVVVTEEDSSVIRAASSGNVTITSSTEYHYVLTTSLAAQECGDCQQGMYWGNQDDGDTMDYYNGTFMGFHEADVTHPDGSVTKTYYFGAEGYGIYNTSELLCNSFTPPCHNAPYWDTSHLSGSNPQSPALHGRPYEIDNYDTDGTTPLSETAYQYSLTCPPSGVSGSPAWTNASNQRYTWDGNLVAELDHDNPVAACDIQTTQEKDYTLNGLVVNSGSAPTDTISFVYDSYGRVTTETDLSSDSGPGSPAEAIHVTSYIQDDALTATSTGVSGAYLIDFPGWVYTKGSDGTRVACEALGYDGITAGTLGQHPSLTTGALTSTVVYSSDCADGQLAGPLTTTTHYDSYGDAEATTDADANGGVSGHVGCTVSDSGSTQYTACQQFDGTYEALPTVTTNDLGQQASVGYGSATSGSQGYGLWPISATDPNHQTTTYSYDALGRMTGVTLPLELSGKTSETTTYTDWCGTSTSAQTPCIEVDTTRQLDSTDTVTSRSFYDGWGHLVETRDQAAGGEDVVQYSEYDPSGRVGFTSIPYFVTAYSGGPGSAAFSTPDETQPGTRYVSYDGLGRLTRVKNALSHDSTTTYTVECGQVGDSACYAQEIDTDPLAHQSTAMTDAFGRQTYTRTYTGNSPSTYQVYATVSAKYDVAGDLIALTLPNGSVTSFSYDLAGRETGMTDPDRGTEIYYYDANGNMTELVDARGSSGGKTYAGYDGLNRQVWRNTSNSPTNAYVTYAYDSTAGGNDGVGELTGETFSNTNGGGSLTLTGSYGYVYDARGRVTSSTLTVDGAPYTTSASYTDGDQVASQTYPDGDVLTPGYTGQGW